MLLNQKQYEEQTKIFNKAATKIQDLLEKTREEFDRGEKNAMTTRLYMGKASAFEESYNLFRSYADIAGHNEKISADTQITSKTKLISIHAKAIRMLLESVGEINEDISNQLDLIESQVKKIDRVLQEID